ncbi:MAG TPA: serine/threonine-protein kinase [Planctomycetota bacterium]|nr:serine/threonine-protein kinase [Planctomycetota bacterium]
MSGDTQPERNATGQTTGPIGPTPPSLAGSLPTLTPGASAAQSRVLKEDALHIGALHSLPNYEIEAKLGEGGMGAVYKARQKNLNRPVAIKVMSQRLAANPQYVARLNREALVLARINHPNVIGCYDLGEHQGLRYVVMEFVEGESLSSLIEKRGCLPQNEALHYLKQAVLGLDNALAVGIIHRDIKPENMLLAKAAPARTTVKVAHGHTLKIADLGLATFTGEDTENTRLTTEGATLGSPHFMSPEQTRGETELDCRTDIYALGMSLYHMVTGELPFSAPTVGAVLAKKLTEQVDDPREKKPELSPGLSLLIQKMTARKRTDRYTSYEELLLDIEAVEHGRAPNVSVLADDAASVLLSDDTLEKLKKHKPVPAEKTASANATEKKRDWVSLIGFGVVGLVVIGFFARYAINLSTKRNTIPTPDQPAVANNPEPKHVAPMPAPVIPPAHVPVTPVAGAKTFDLRNLIEDQSIKGWSYKGDAKDFGFQDGAVFLQSFTGWNIAERALPSHEFVLTALMQTPREVDDFEIQLGFSDKEYIAFGLRLPPDKPLFAYVERRDTKTNELIGKPLETRGELNADNWQDLRVHFWDGQATCFLNDKLLVSAEVPKGGEKSDRIRIAVRKGIGQWQLLKVAPRK